MLCNRYGLPIAAKSFGEFQEASEALYPLRYWPSKRCGKFRPKNCGPHEFSGASVELSITGKMAAAPVAKRPTMKVKFDPTKVCSSRPKIHYDSINQVRGLDVAITTTAADDEQARALLTGLGLPFAAPGSER